MRVASSMFLKLAGALLVEQQAQSLQVHLQQVAEKTVGLRMCGS